MDFKYFLLLQLWLGLLISQVLLDGSFGLVYLLALQLAFAYQHQLEKRKLPLWLSSFRKLLLCCLISSVQSLSHVRLFATPWTAARQASLSITNSLSLLKLMSIESVMPSNHLNLCHPLLLPSILPSIWIFSNESVLRIRWPRYWSFSYSISPFNEYSELISFRIDWLDLLAVQGTLKSLLQHHSKSINSSVLSFF